MLLSKFISIIVKQMKSFQMYILIFVSIWMAETTFVAGSTQHTALDVNLTFNNPVIEGDDMVMKCSFIVPERTDVSSVKWYKGTREIFRYEHKPKPKKQILPLGNLTIDDQLSDVQTLFLKHVPHFMSGEISCEVTLEDPSAKAVTKSAKLLVAIPPTEGPSLEASLVKFSHNHFVHRKLIANCTSAPSKPASNLTIYVNESPYSPEIMILDTTKEKIHVQPDILVNNNLIVKRIELELDLSQHFINGKIRIKCASTLYNLHNRTSDEYVLEETVTSPQQRTQNDGATNTKFTPGCGSIFLLLAIIHEVFNIIML